MFRHLEKSSILLYLHHMRHQHFSIRTAAFKEKKRKKKPSRLFLKVQKPVVDIQMDKSTPSTSLFSSGVYNPGPGFCPQGTLIPPSTADRPPAPLERRNQCVSGAMEEGVKSSEPSSYRFHPERGGFPLWLEGRALSQRQVSLRGIIIITQQKKQRKCCLFR